MSRKGCGCRKTSLAAGFLFAAERSKMFELVLIIVIGTSIWVLVDASQRRLGKGESAIVWFISCLLLWIIAFPWYLGKRQNYPLKEK